MKKLRTRSTAETAATIRFENVKLTYTADSFHPESEDGDAVFHGKTDTVLHRHGFTEIFLCARGKIVIDLADDRVELAGGSALVLPPHAYHHLERVGEDSVWYVFSAEAEKLDNRAAADAYTPLAAMLAAPAPARIDASLVAKETLAGLLSPQTGFPASGLLCAAVLMTLADAYAESRSQRADRSQRAGRAQRAGCARTKTVPYIMQLDEILNAPAFVGLPAADIAEKLYISTRQLDRIVKKYYGMTLHRFVSESRVANAKKLLAAGTLSVEQVAEKAGFHSRAAFYREFTRSVGVSPAAFRKKTAGDRPV